MYKEPLLPATLDWLRHHRNNFDDNPVTVPSAVVQDLLPFKRKEKMTYCCYLVLMLLRWLIVNASSIKISSTVEEIYSRVSSKLTNHV